MVGWDMFVDVSFSMQIVSSDGHFTAHPNLLMVLICLARQVYGAITNFPRTTTEGTDVNARHFSYWLYQTLYFITHTPQYLVQPFCLYRQWRYGLFHPPQWLVKVGSPWQNTIIWWEWNIEQWLQVRRYDTNQNIQLHTACMQHWKQSMQQRK